MLDIHLGFVKHIYPLVYHLRSAPNRISFVVAHCGLIEIPPMLIVFAPLIVSHSWQNSIHAQLLCERLIIHAQTSSKTTLTMALGSTHYGDT